ncbi:hypothetical protein Pfo_004895 [Paulownia fortunei]|nr:hypothetical protein Pfo_004895 [Paulownia fortunei]
MRKRRNLRGSLFTGGESSTRSGIDHGGGTSQKNRFSVFEFADDDLLVETGSRKFLSKIGSKSPGRKPAHDQHMETYDFLERFAQGTTTPQNDSGNEMSDVDVSYNFFEDRTFRSDVTISLGSLNYESQAFSLLKHRDFECSTCGGKSLERGSRKPRGCTTDKKHNKVLYVDSDEDGTMELGSSTFSFDLAENEESLEEQSEHGINTNDCEEVVVVAPNYVKYGKTHYTNCFLTFSRRYIRLEGSPLCERKRPYCLEWSSFDILEIEYQQYESVKADVVNLLLKSVDSKVAETCNTSSGILKLEFVVLDDPHWSKKQEEIKSLDLKYKAAECNFNEPFEDIIYPEGDPDAILISRRDIELLQPRRFINDTIIDFYIKYLLNKTQPEERHRFHFFNTFFFRKLVNMDQDLSRAWEGREAFKHVRKWTRNVNLFEKDYIFIPVNFSLHWSLIVICHPGVVANLRGMVSLHYLLQFINLIIATFSTSKLQYRCADKDVDDSSKVPCILHMDSIRGSHRGFENLIRSYLWEEWKQRLNKLEADMATKFSNLHFVMLQLPQQENLFDCGLFLLHYAELFLEQASNFSTTKYCDFLNKDWFLPAEVSLKKRDHIRNLIHRIVEDNCLKDLPAACNDKYLPSDLNYEDSSVEFVEVNGVKDSCHGVKFNSSDDYGNKGQQSFVDMLEPMNIDKSVTDESFQTCKQLVPINQFSNMRLPLEEVALEKQATLPPGDTASRDEADEDDKPMPPSSRHSCFRTTEMKTPWRNFSGKSPIIIDVQYEEDSIPEIASATERETDKCEYISMSSEDLAACVVEDSKEESWKQSIRKTTSCRAR